jgi:hypothetical protein
MCYACHILWKIKITNGLFVMNQYDTSQGEHMSEKKKSSVWQKLLYQGLQSKRHPSDASKPDST